MTATALALKIGRMTTFARRLREARENAGLSQESVADEFKIARAAVSQWESDTKATIPETNRIARLAQLYNVSADWLLTGREFVAHQPRARYRADPRRGQHGANTEPAPEIHPLPLISWIQAGRAEPVADPHPTGNGDKILYTTRRVGPHAYALRVRGDSMEPRFHDGDIIVVDPERTPVPGSFVVVRFDNAEEATFKQLVVDAGRRYLKPLNERYPIIEIDRHATLCGTWVQTIVDGV